MGFAKKVEISARKFWYRLGRLAVSLLARGGLELTVQWKAPIPNGPKILVANHPSTIDPAILTTLVKDHINILIHGELFKIPFFGKSLRSCGHIPVSEGGGAWALEEAGRRLQAGESVVIFPEGEISPADGAFKTIHSGAARLAISTGASVIPIGIHLDASQIRVTKSSIDDQEELGTWYFHGPYALTIGHSMTFSGEVESRQLVREVTEQIKARIVALSIESASRVRSKRKLSWVRTTRWWLWAPVRLVRSWSVLANHQINY